MTSAPRDGVGRLRLDDERVFLPASLDPAANYDIVMNGHDIWAMLPERDATDGARGWAAPWPKNLKRFLVGRADVVLREHTTGTVIARTHHVFGGDDSRELTVTDHHGNRLVVGKWGRLFRPLESDDDTLIGELLDQVLDLIECVESKAGLPSFICYGTLLGAVRNGRLIGHDNDIDIAYASAKEAPVDIARESAHVERVLRDAGWVVRRGSSVRLNVRIRLGDGSVRFVDVFTACWTEGVLYIPSDTGFRMPRETVLPLTTIDLMGRQMPAPAQSEALLEATYGPGWKVPDPSFKYETPRGLARRLNGWYGGLITGRKSWDGFAKDTKRLVPKRATSFARWVQGNYPSDRPLVDLGAGTGRDSVWFARHSRHVTAVDYSGTTLVLARKRARRLRLSSLVDIELLNLYDLRAVLTLGARLSRTDQPVDLYGRFLLHALTPAGQEHVVRLASMSLRRGGYLFLEFRTPEDQARDHEFDRVRHYVDPMELRAQIEASGGTVVRQVKGTGLAPLRSEDPVVCRMVATWADGGAWR